MTRLLIVPMLVVALIAAGTVSVFAEKNQEWMTLVTQAGCPRIELDLAQSGRPGPFGKLTLFHRLYFDGVRHFSRLSIVELESRLVPRGETGYEWQTLTGQTLLLQKKGSAKTRSSNAWRIVNDTASGEIAVVGGDQEVYIYRKCRLVEYEYKGQSFRIQTVGAVQMVLDPLNRIIVKRVEEENGKVSIVAHDQTVVMQYNENRELLSILANHGKQVEFGYSSGLLVEIRELNQRRLYEWGGMIFPKYENLERCMPPVVVRCGRFGFKYVVGRQSMFATVSIGKTPLAEWTFFLGDEKDKTMADDYPAWPIKFFVKYLAQ